MLFVSIITNALSTNSIFLNSNFYYYNINKIEFCKSNNYYYHSLFGIDLSPPPLGPFIFWGEIASTFASLSNRLCMIPYYQFVNVIYIQTQLYIPTTLIISGGISMANLAYLIRPSALLRWIDYNIFIII